MAKHQIDIPNEVLNQLNILKAVGQFKNIPDTANYVIAYNLGELVSKEARTLRREILKQKNNPRALTYAPEDVDSKKYKEKRRKIKND